MPYGLKVGVAQQVLDILFATSEKVIQANDLHQASPQSMQSELGGSRKHIHDLLFRLSVCTSGFLQSLRLQSLGLGFSLCAVWF